MLEVSAQVLEKITRRDNPQNVVGVFKQRFAPEAAIGREGIWVALDRVRDPGNLGTIIRTADAAGLAGVALVGALLRPVRAGGGARDDGLDLPRAGRADERGRADRAGEAPRRAARRHASHRGDDRLSRGGLSGRR